MRCTTAALCATVALFFLSPVIAQADTSALVQENFQQADANSDGMLVYAEFASFIDLNAADGVGNAARVSARGMHARAFARVDTDADGVVTVEELQAVP